MILLNMTKPPNVWFGSNGSGSKCLFSWASHLFIHSTDSFKRLIHSETSQLAVVMNGPLNHWLTRFVQKRGFIQQRNTAVCCSETLNSSAVALIGTIFVGKTEQKLSIFSLKAKSLNFNHLFIEILLYNSVSHCNRADIVIQGNIMSV